MMNCCVITDITGNYSTVCDNSTISCCEVLNNLIFPAHEQHHNNSFLISTVVLGQSNLAAGATIGSNHNSRANDNEIRAGRGFWPGLCSSVKHSCRFASFVLLSKAAYPAELDIPLPFSLLNNNEVKGQLEVMPAFWWMYNMYALARNTWKFTNRDKRKNKVQNIEFDSLAPDTIEEILSAMELLELWAGKASSRSKNEVSNYTDEKFIQIGKELLLGAEDNSKHLEVLGENMEKSPRKVIILKVHKAYHAYNDMLHYYSIKNLMEYLNSHQEANFTSMCNALQGKRIKTWINLGGQLIPAHDVDQLRSEIGSGKLSSWKDIHQCYDNLWNDYPLGKQKHAYSILCKIMGIDFPMKEKWFAALDKAIVIQEYIRDQVYNSRQKDFENPFRQATYRNMEEMEATIGTIEDNSFVKQIRTETDIFKQRIEELKKR